MLTGLACVGICLSVGLQASFGEGYHPYVGSGLGLQLTGGVNVAPGQHITTGWNCAFQYTPGEGVSPTVQVGVADPHFDKEGRFRQEVFGEVGGIVGIGLPVGYTCVYIF